MQFFIFRSDIRHLESAIVDMFSALVFSFSLWPFNPFRVSAEYLISIATGIAKLVRLSRGFSSQPYSDLDYAYTSGWISSSG